MVEASLLLEKRVRLPDEPVRIVSLSPAVTDVLVMLGLSSRLVGVSVFCPLYVSEVKGKPLVGSYMDVDWGKLEELDPDIVFVGMGVQSRLVDMLMGRGYSVYAVPLPTSIAGILDNLLRISYVVNKYDVALRVYEEYFDKINRIRGLGRGLRVYVELWVGEPRSIGQSSYLDDGLRITGFKNIYSHVREPYPKPDFEYVKRADPDAVIISRELARIDVDELVAKRGWSSLRAVKNNMVVVLDTSMPLAHPSPRVIDVLEHVALKLSRG